MSEFIQTNFKEKRAYLTDDQLACNALMSGLRKSVEWQFNKTLRYWAFLDFSVNLKLHLQPIGMYYIVATILSNCHTCIYGSLTSDFYDCHPPSLHDYLNTQ